MDKLKAFLKSLGEKIDAELKFWMPSARERYDSTNTGRYESHKNEVGNYIKPKKWKK